MDKSVHREKISHGHDEELWWVALAISLAALLALAGWL
jgi:hypothetical protein